MIEQDINFFSSYEDLILQIEKIEPLAYAKTRNHVSGAVSRLSPYITHGIINPALVGRLLLERLGKQMPIEDAYQQCEKYIFQLAWREFFQRVWQHQNDNIFSDLKHKQSGLVSDQLPLAIMNGNTGIKVIDQSIQELVSTGYIHNHARMWIASLITNIAQTDWRYGSDWMHYYLLDGDLASNTLSWQWVAGTFSQKPYLANQENINRFSSIEQNNTWLDVSYETLAKMQHAPPVFNERVDWTAMTKNNLITPEDIAQLIDIKNVRDMKLDPTQPLYLRSIYNLDPNWHAKNKQQLLLIEPEFIQKFPMSIHRWKFKMHWAAKIPNLQIVTGRFDDLLSLPDVSSDNIVLQEHPVCTHWQGKVEPRPWLFDNMQGDYPSFYKFWNVVKNRIKKEGISATLSLADQ